MAAPRQFSRLEARDTRGNAFRPVLVHGDVARVGVSRWGECRRGARRCGRWSERCRRCRWIECCWRWCWSEYGVHRTDSVVAKKIPIRGVWSNTVVVSMDKRIALTLAVFVTFMRSAHTVAALAMDGRTHRALKTEVGIATATALRLAIQRASRGNRNVAVRTRPARGHDATAVSADFGHLHSILNSFHAFFQRL